MHFVRLWGRALQLSAQQRASKPGSARTRISAATGLVASSATSKRWSGDGAFALGPTATRSVHRVFSIESGQESMPQGPKATQAPSRAEEYGFPDHSKWG